MKVTSEDILYKLPAYRDEWVLVTEDQYVPDIIREMMEMHRECRGLYDAFAYKFCTSNVDKLANKLYRFCKENIKYHVETDKRQTVAIPQGILTREYGDCKHYALMNAGIIDSLNRTYGYNFDWCYYFAGYDGATEPYHVFVGVYDYDAGEEVWIDPTPGSGGNPTVLVGKKP
jgi:hypothetical protein